MTKKQTHTDDASRFTLKDMVRDWWTIGMAIFFVFQLFLYTWSIMN